MSNKMNARGYRRELLATVSAFALIASVYPANAADADRPILWIEGGWHFEHVGGGQQLFDPPYMATIAQGGFTSPLSIQNAMSYSYGADGKISFQPEGSDWMFSASVRYGRAQGHRNLHQEKTIPPYHFTIKYHPLTATAPNNYADMLIGNSEKHLIADFEAGKDVGLGLLASTSTLDFGVRYAQFREHASNITHARPDNHFETTLLFGKYVFPFQRYHNYVGAVTRDRSFRGLGPTISWSNSTPLAGNEADTEIALDWGANAALLFGRQKASVHGHVTGKSHYFKGFRETAITTAQYPIDSDRSRSVVVPNLGGFAGLSLKWTNAKVSVGYRADIFFGAIDGGVATRHETTRGFYGPFASISVGLGD